LVSLSAMSYFLTCRFVVSKIESRCWA
jgi:hypothetical protein